MLQQMMHHLCIINHLYIEEVEEWHTSKIISEYSKLKDSYKVSQKNADKITLNERELHLIPFTSLTLGQFIDIEHFVSESYLENMHKIAAIIYLSKSGGGMEEEVYENYAKINLNYRSELIQDLPAQLVVGACDKYLTFRKGFFDSYDIFNDPFAGSNPDEMDEDERLLFEKEKKLHEERAGNQWTDLLNVLAHNDLTKFKEILSTNLFMNFNQLTYLYSEAKNQTK